MTTLYQETLYEIKPLLRSRGFSLYRANAEHHLGGPKVQELETLFCEYLNVKHSIAVSSATSGLHISLLACGVRREIYGNPVITSPVTFSATASAIIMAGGIPSFRDIEATTYGLDPHNLKDLSDVKVIVPVHLHGHPMELDGLPKLVIIEDASQALGAIYKGRKAGTIGKVGVFSFNQSKQINCGEGGMVVTNDDEIARKLRLLRNHGETQEDILGYNYRLTELQAAVLIPQFKRIEKTLSDTIELCERVSEELKDAEDLVPPFSLPDCRHVYYTYPVKVKRVSRDDLQNRLAEKGIYFGKGGYKPLYKFPFYRQLGKQEFPISEDCYKTVMFTNIFKPPMKLREAERIARLIKDTAWQSKKDSTIL